MKWASRIIAMVNGGLFGYWCGFATTDVNWWLWAKFMLVSTLAFLAGDFYRTAKMNKCQNSQ